ncbi:MAG: hypothetical protein NTY10_02695 [Candidatus Omnitrophica bacterium]|nr:hypothetical protein [Candidatus Omnitrophota bacterium]
MEQVVLENYQSERKIKIEVLPQMGAQLKSFSINGQEMLFFSEEMFFSPKRDFTGSFLMFPTPCRLAGSKYRFEGREILQRKSGEDIFIHGLIRDETFEIRQGNDFLEASIEIGPQHPVHEGYPFPCYFAVKYEIIKDGLRISFNFENRGQAPAPFGFGVHPFWRLEGKRKDIAIKVPCQYQMELMNLIPTGKTEPVEGTPLDLRDWKSIDGNNIDNVFYGRIPDERGGVQWQAKGIQLNIDASPELTHMIAYAPEGKPFVCVENLTCAPDAPNLYSKGFKKESGLVVVPPRERYAGWITWTVEEIK